MTGPTGPLGAGLPGGPVALRDAAPGAGGLREASADLESVFLQKLFQAMRETVPEGGALEAGSGADMFRDLMDRHLAEEMASRLRSGVGDAVYRQIRSAAPGTPVATPEAGPIRPGADGPDPRRGGRG